MRRRWLAPLLVSLSLAVACGDDDGGDILDRPAVDMGPEAPTDAGPNACVGDERRVGLIYYGTLEPTYVPLSDGQVWSVVNFDGCSGMLITDDWVLTARHCGVRSGSRLCIGVSPSNSDVCFTAGRVIDEPGGDDITLVELDAPASSRADWAEPVPILTVAMDDSWIGETAEASGFGQAEDGTSGTRKWTAEPIVALRRSSVSIDGMGERGVCFGDSGGPLMVIAPDATVRVAGVLSGGDETCVGVDTFTRADVYVDWIETYTGPTAIEGASCGSVSAEGRCLSGDAVYCEDDVLRRDDCAGDEFCGWDPALEGYRCRTGDDPCAGLDVLGECAGDVARWCDRGELRSLDCGSCDQVCTLVEEVGGYYCQVDACAGLDYLGRCNGSVAEWCDDGEMRTRDCAADGLDCGYINDDIGYYCGRRR